jgi:OmpA-OmpF porin, OOP family
MNHPRINTLIGISSLMVGLGLLAAPAQAQQRVPESNGPGLDTHMFRPAVDSKGFFTVNGSNVLGHKDVSFGLITDYGHSLMRLEDGHGQKALIKHAFHGTLSFSYGLLNRLVLGLQAPIQLQAGDEVTQVGPANGLYDSGRLNAQTLPFVAVHGKLRLLRNDQAIGIAILLQAGFPTGSASRDLGGAPGPWVWPQLVVEKSFIKKQPIRLALNIGYRSHFASGVTTFNQLSGGYFESSKGKLTGGAALSVRVLEPLDLVAELYGTQQIGSSTTATNALSQELIGGIKLFVEKNSYLSLGGGVRINNGFEAADQRGFIGFTFEPSIGDRDGDGIPDDQDDCPDQKEDFDGFQDTRENSPPGKYGCPDPDNDNDGIPDTIDKCPNEAEDKDGDRDDDGCPEISDKDGDGIPDSKDKCPNMPEDKDGFQDEDGCPDLDNDGDGIPDTKDQCPNEAEDLDGFQDEDGCPDPDNDRDGVPDVKDKCPNVPGDNTGQPDDDGCPKKKDKKRAVIVGENIMILDKIQFQTGSAKILPQSQPIIDTVAKLLKENADIGLLEIQGHADSRGSAQMNLMLTKARANSVMSALLQRKIAAKRLRAMGYGEYCPVDKAITAQAFEKNRRVEFKIVIRDGKPTNTKLGCEEATKNGVKSP